MTTMTAILGGEEVTIHLGAGGDGLPSGGLLGLDVESTWMTDRGQFDPEFFVRLVQIGTEHEAWVFDVKDSNQRLNAEYVLRDSGLSFCSHTPMDVLAVWAEFGIDISARNVDTRMLAIQADPDKDDDRDLKTLATKYGMPELAAADRELMAWMRERWVEAGGKKNAAKSAVEEAGWNALAEMPAEEWPEVFIRYAGLDAIACRRLAPMLVPATQAPPELLRVDQWLHVRANRQQMTGKRIDTEALEILHAEARSVTGDAKSKAEELTNGININGPKIIDWLGEHGVDWNTWQGATTGTGAPSLAKDNIKLLAGMLPEGAAVAREVVEHMITQKGHLDLLRKTDDITRRLVMHTDGIARIHPLLNPIGATTTARMSSSGPNIQNFSKKDPRMRGLFLPEPGYTFVACDFAQIELRVVAALAREDKMIDVIKAGGDLHNLTVELLAGLGVEIDRQTAKMTNFLCVPSEGEHEAEILTRRGWLRHDEVQVGDETLGYAEGVMRWTKIEAVHHYNDAEVVQLGNGQSGWSAVCTPDHRWVENRRRDRGKAGRVYEDGFVRAADIGKESRLLLSAPAETDTKLDLTEDECALIGWAYTDGHIRMAPLTGRTSQGIRGWKRNLQVSVTQSKPAGIVELEKVLASIPHKMYVRKPVGDLRPIRDYKVAPTTARDIWRRAGLMDGEETLTSLVLRMSRSQREAFVKAMFDAEGHIGPSGQRIHGQNIGETCDAIELGEFLNGNYVRRNSLTHKGNKPFQGMTISKPRVTGQRMVKTPIGRSDVWCVTTGLGSWVMRQGGRIMLTGNCVYGGGAKALHAQSSIPIDTAQQVIRGFKEAYPSIAMYSKYLGFEQDAVRTISNRRLPVTRVKGSGDRAGEIRSYANLNYAVQSAAREVLVDAWMRLEEDHHRPGVVWLPVHDELVLMVPDDDVAGVIADVEDSMRMDFRGVPVSADAIVLRDSEGISRWMSGDTAEKIQKEMASS